MGPGEHTDPHRTLWVSPGKKELQLFWNELLPLPAFWGLTGEKNAYTVSKFDQTDRSGKSQSLWGWSAATYKRSMKRGEPGVDRNRQWDSASAGARRMGGDPIGSPIPTKEEGGEKSTVRLKAGGRSQVVGDEVLLA